MAVEDEEERNLAALEDYVREYNSGAGYVDRCFTPAAVLTLLRLGTSTAGRADLQAAAEAVLATLPDRRTCVVDASASGNIVVARMRFRGTPTADGPFGPGGELFVAEILNVITFRDALMARKLEFPLGFPPRDPAELDIAILKDVVRLFGEDEGTLGDLLAPDVDFRQFPSGVAFATRQDRGELAQSDRAGVASRQVVPLDWGVAGDTLTLRFRRTRGADDSAQVRSVQPSWQEFVTVLTMREGRIVRYYEYWVE
ncbi:MAG TPA: nuclear transport factor 2 family protein [Dehalococcoidia bacterium]|nr:nuclear transport factor 2 family protein [Dehalococcoidia bacterium]